MAALSTPQITPASPRPGFFLAAGNAQYDRLYFVNDALIRANASQFVDYIALRTLRDINCGLAGDRTFTNNLQNFTRAVYAIAAGHGFDGGVRDTVALMISASVTIKNAPPAGHVDPYFAVQHRQLIEQPILKWLEHICP